MLLRRYDHTHAPALRELLLDIHDDCYAASENPTFDSRDRFAWFVDRWSQRPGWDCVIGHDQAQGDQAVGFAYGAPLATGSPWWDKVTGLDADFTHETGTRTFAVSEVMVRPPWRKTGTATRLHDELLDGRPEERATLLVDSGHPKVQALYETWGYQAVGTTQPFDDAPVMTAMIRSLRRQQSG
ncbi:GNAT family N-acetyltransferase [Streptomyces albireticuli]|uniref:GNAT family N-acetyltransferase n=1 Tax=Streptomyces albireticuli TaxID=1940 RepID=UPI0027E29604|nr:GNAT family N-acetyltransferase [Streptomyces albireticuli]